MSSASGASIGAGSCPGSLAGLSCANAGRTNRAAERQQAQGHEVLRHGISALTRFGPRERAGVHPIMWGNAAGGRKLSLTFRWQARGSALRVQAGQAALDSNARFPAAWPRVREQPLRAGSALSLRAGTLLASAARFSDSPAGHCGVARSTGPAAHGRRTNPPSPPHRRASRPRRHPSTVRRCAHTGSCSHCRGR